MPEVTRTWRLNGKRPLAPAVIAEQAEQFDLPMDWHGLVNGITVPRGVRWGTAHFLVAESDLAGLQAGAINIECYHGEVGKKPTVTTWKKWYVESFQAITKQGTPAYWVRLADPRFLLNNTAGDGIRINYRSSEGTSGYIAETAVSASVAYTWQEVLAILWDYLPVGVAGSCPVLPYAPTTTPENLCFDGISVWRAINQVLTAIGCSVVYNPFNGAFTFIDLREDQTRLTGALLFDEKAGGGEYAIPEKASCIFHTMPSGDVSTLAPFQSAPHIVESTIGGPQGKYPIVDTMWYYTGRSMTARANEIGTSLAGLLDPRQNTFGATYAGVIEQVPGSRVTSVRWVSDGTHGMQTMLFYEPEPIDWPKLPMYYEAAKGSRAVVFELNEQLDRGVGQTAEAEVVESSDTSLTAVGATITLINTGGMQGLTGAQGVAVLFNEQWWVFVLDQQALLATFTFTDSTHTTSGTFSISDQATFTISDLTSLTPYPFNDLPPTAIITNPLNLIALSGDIGLVAYNVETDEYVLIDVYPAKTRRFYFRIITGWPPGLDQTSTNAELICPDSTHHGGDTNWATITLRDRFNVAPNASDGDIGICQLNYKTGQFDIMEVSHRCRIGRGFLYEGFSDTPDFFDVKDVIGFDGRSPLELPTDQLRVFNELNIQAMATGDPVEIRWNTIEGHYYAMPPAVEVNYIRYFELAEDANVTGRAYIYAYPALLDETTSDLTRDESIETPFKLYQWQLILGSPNYAKAGYTGIYSTDDQGRSVFVNGPCIGGCQADGTLNLDLPAGEVGTAYSHTVTGTDIDDTTIDASNLPDGLTFDSVLNEINGTPTVAGTFLVVLTATSNNACAITNIMEVVITEAP